MVEIVRDLWRQSSPTLLLKQGQLPQVAQDIAQLTLECICRWRPPSLYGQLVFNHPNGTKGFCSIQIELCVSICARCLLFSQWASLIRVWLILLPSLPSVISMH